MYDETGRQLYCCRNSGGFCLFTGNSFSNTDSGHLSGIGDMLDDVYALESYKRKGQKKIKPVQDSFPVSYGYVFSSEKKWNSVYDIAKAADKRMYESKANFYHEKERDRRK